MLFDLDGVLIDSESQYTQIWHKINARFNTGYDESFPVFIKGFTLDKILEKYFPGEIQTSIVNELYRLEDEMKYEWLPGARELLEGLRERGIPAALVTSSNDKKMAHLRQDLPELESYFDAIVTADKITRSKPDPEGYLLGAKLIGRNAVNCAVFEDSFQGVQAGHASGAYVVGVEGTLPAAKLEPFSDVIVNTLVNFDIDKLANTLASR